MHTLRTKLSLFLIPLALAGASFAHAQGVGMPSTPIGVDLRKVPVGSWAEYAISAENTPGMKGRFALVSRQKNDHTMEMAMDGGQLAMMGGKMTIKMVMATQGNESQVKQAVMQMGTNDPMEMPTNAPNAQAAKFSPPDPKSLVGSEEVKVAAGSFKTQHYRTTTPQGHVVDVWLSDKAPPIGLVKMKSTPKAGSTNPMGQPIPASTFELAALGKGAKPTITKPAKPFDPAALMGGGRPPAGAPPAPAADKPAKTK